MKKDKTILKLIEKLRAKINFTQLEIVDYWEADRCAIGFKKENRLVYISTYNYVENNKSIYDFDFETIDENINENVTVVRIGRNVSEAELINEVKLFLEV